MRRFAHGNARVRKGFSSLCPCLICIVFIQINFGFCKGDDNFGGRKRKELDDFLKSLGKSMNLVMYRMQDTERVRTKLREDRRQELRTKAEREEERENRGWRGTGSGERISLGQKTWKISLRKTLEKRFRKSNSCPT